MGTLMCKGHPNRRPGRDLSEGVRGQEMRGDIHEAYQAPQLKTQPASVGPQAGPCRARGGDSVAFCRHRPEECPPKVLAPTQPSGCLMPQAGYNPPTSQMQKWAG